MQGRVAFAIYGYLLVMAASFFSATANASAAVEKRVAVTFPYVYTDPVYKDISDYIHDLLDLILTKGGKPYTLQPVQVPPVPMSRTVMYLNAGKFNVAWAHSDASLEALLRPIRIPIFRGLGGWRLLFIRDEDTRFDGITTLDGLREMMFGQGHDWPDTDILQKNGFRVRTAINRDNLFQLLKHHRIDAFPRSVTEIWDESILPGAKDLKVEPNLILRYPTAFYLLLNYSDEALARHLERGFEIAVADGSFRQLFLAWKGDIFVKARLPERRIFSITNPVLGEDTTLNRPELWFDLEDLKQLPLDR